FGMVASLQFHKPTLFANCAWLLYGRMRPAATNAFLYGFCLQAAIGVSLWLLCRLGRARVFQLLLITFGAKFWNLGVTIGIIGILAGDGSGYENFDMPRYAALFLFIGYAVMATFILLTSHRRSVRELYVSEWFLLAAMFWFPWIFSTAA